MCTLKDFKVGNLIKRKKMINLTYVAEFGLFLLRVTFISIWLCQGLGCSLTFVYKREDILK